MKFISKIVVLIFFPAFMTLTAQPANPNASQEAHDLLGYLTHVCSETFHGVIAGQNCGHGTEIHEKYPQYVETIHDSTGKWLGLVGLDYEYIREYTIDELYRVNKVLTDHWNRGGLLTLNMTPTNPFHEKGNVYNTENIDLPALLDPNEDVHYDWMDKLARIAQALVDLEQAGVVVLWRPMQEMGGSHFGYGDHYDQENFRALWRHMFDYFTRVRQLNNVLWVFSPLGGGENRGYPGDEYVDIIAGTSYDKNLTIWGYSKAKTYGKPIGMGEYGHSTNDAPGDYDMRRYAEEIQTNYPRVAFFTCRHNWSDVHMAIVSNQHWQEMIMSDAVITADEIDRQGHSTVQAHKTHASPQVLGACPNPFNGGTTLSFQVDSPQPVELIIYDIIGRKMDTLLQGEILVGDQNIVWFAEQAPSGLYWAVLRMGSHNKSVQIVHLK